MSERGPEVPFTLTLHGLGAAGRESALRCDRVLRALPGRRLVARGVWAGREVVVKVFYGPKAGRDLLRERDGLEILDACGVATPAVLGTAAVDGGVCLVTEWLGEQPVADRGDASALVAVLARLHAGGARHGDPHVGNFLKNGAGGVCAVDGGAVAGAGRVSLRRGIDDLAALLAELGVRDAATRGELLAGYCRERAVPFDAALEVRLGVRAERAADRRVRRYRRKTLRECSEFRCVREAGRTVRYAKDAYGPGLAGILADPDRAVESGQLVKLGNTATVSRVRAADGSFVVKRYNVKNAWHAMRTRLRSSRAQRAWQNGHALRLIGIPTARPLALIVERGALTRGRAYLVMEDLGPEDLAARVARVGVEAHVAAKVGALLGALEAWSLCHRDTKATNFLVRNERVHLVDLDALGRVPRTARCRDRARFLDNWRDADVRDAFAAALAEHA